MKLLLVRLVLLLRLYVARRVRRKDWRRADIHSSRSSRSRSRSSAAAVRAVAACGWSIISTPARRGVEFIAIVTRGGGGGGGGGVRVGFTSVLGRCCYDRQVDVAAADG